MSNEHSMHMTEDGIALMTGTSNPDLAQAIAKELQLKIDQPVTIFKDGERRVRGQVNLRRKHAIIIQSPSMPSINDHIVETNLMIDAARRASADEITVVSPYFPYSRQDRKDRPRTSISTAVVARTYQALGANRIVTVDIHSEQQQGNVDIPWDNVYASYALIPEVKKLGLTNVKVVAPDLGGTRRSLAYGKRLDAKGIAIAYKQRDLDVMHASDTLFHLGDVKGFDLVIPDDIVSSGGTLFKPAILFKNQGAGRIYGVATHGLFLGDALERLSDSPLETLYVTDTINHRDAVKVHPKINVVSVAPLLAEAITCIHSGESLSEKLINPVTD